MATGTNSITDVETEPVTVAGAIVAAGLLGTYAAWIAADILPRWLTAALVLVGGGYGLLRQETRRARIQNVLYAVAGLLLLTPVLMILPDAIQADAFGVGVLSIVFMTANVVLFVVFGVVAALIAGVARKVGETA